MATTGAVMLGIGIASGQRVKRSITVEQYLMSSDNGKGEAVALLILVEICDRLITI